MLLVGCVSIKTAQAERTHRVRSGQTLAQIARRYRVRVSNLAGANSMFVGDELLTTPNPSPSSDASLLQKLGLNAVSTDDKHARDAQR